MDWGELKLSNKGRKAPEECCRKGPVQGTAAGVRAPRGRAAAAPRRGRPRGGRPLRGRLRCAARSAGARPNSLRGLRPLRSDSGRESDNEARARAARGPALLATAPDAGPGAAQPPLAANVCTRQARRLTR
jgi:hypothetical protein